MLLRFILAAPFLAFAAAAFAGDEKTPPPSATEAPAALTPAPESEPKRSKELGKDPKGCTWIESEATVAVGENETRHQARASAMNEARKTAMEDFIGVDITSRFLDYRQEGLKDQRSLTESLLQTTRNGRVLKEKIITANYKDAADCSDCRFYVKLHSCLLPLPADQDKNFRVELEINRERFVVGDTAKLKVTPTRDSYIYIYDVGTAWETSLIVPDDNVGEAQGQVLVKAGQTWLYPPPENKKVTLEAQLPDAKSKISAETIRVIATRTPLPRKLAAPGLDGYLGVLQRMNESKTEWAEDVKAFTIYKN